MSNRIKALTLGVTFRSAMVAAGMMVFSSMTMAGPQEDYDLGWQRYLEGDMLGAMAVLRKASDAGNYKAMALLAEILDKSEFDDDAIALYRKAADNGEPDGMVGLGGMMAAGEGTEKDPVEGLRWIRKAAELGQGHAINIMAQAYIRLQFGLTEADQNSSDGLRWVKEAAAKDFLPAVDALADAYRTGKMLGVSADPVLAAQYLAQGNKIRQIEPSKGKKKKKLAAG